MPKYLKGFTLVELLVVISIISILAVIGAVIFSEIQKKGRDARRQSDLAVIQSALEQYHADQGYYPDSIGDSIVFGSRNYLKKVPTDPQTTNSQYSYSYQALPNTPTACIGSACVQYCIFARMEITSNGVDLTGCNLSVSGYNYEVTSP